MGITPASGPARPHDATGHYCRTEPKVNKSVNASFITVAGCRLAGLYSGPDVSINDLAPLASKTVGPTSIHGGSTMDRLCGDRPASALPGRSRRSRFRTLTVTKYMTIGSFFIVLLRPPSLRSQPICTPPILSNSIVVMTKSPLRLGCGQWEPRGASARRGVKAGYVEAARGRSSI